MSGLTISRVLNAVTSHAAATGLFEAVNGHEPTSAPTRGGLTCAVWGTRVGPARAMSGLDVTTARVVLTLRVFASMRQEPQDGIDPQVIDAVDALMAAYTGHFALGGLIRNVDLLGSGGIALEAELGYVEQDGAVYRAATITLPLIVNDAWDQEA